MNLDDIINLIKNHGIHLIAAVTFVTPFVWLFLHFLYKERIDNLKDNIVSMESQLKSHLEKQPNTITLQEPLQLETINHEKPLELPLKQDLPVFRLKSAGFEGGDDAVFETVIESLRIAKTTDQACFRLVLPEAIENETRIEELKKIPSRNELEKEELVARLGSKVKNEYLLAKFHRAFHIIFQNSTFRTSAKLDSYPEYTYEVLVGLRVQEFRQIEFSNRTVLYLTTTATERVYGQVLFTNDEYKSENTRYLNDNFSKQYFLPGLKYELELFTPKIVRTRCLAAIALMLAETEKLPLPTRVYDIKTWHLSENRIDVK